MLPTVTTTTCNIEGTSVISQHYHDQKSAIKIFVEISGSTKSVVIGSFILFFQTQLGFFFRLAVLAHVISLRKNAIAATGVFFSTTMKWCSIFVTSCL